MLFNFIFSIVMLECSRTRTKSVARNYLFFRELMTFFQDLFTSFMNGDPEASLNCVGLGKKSVEFENTVSVFLLRSFANILISNTINDFQL